LAKREGDRKITTAVFKLIFGLMFLLIDIPDRMLIDLKQCNEKHSVML